MLIWPAHSSVWKFLEKPFLEVPLGTVLRFAIRKRVSMHLEDQIQFPVIARLRQEDADLHDEIKTNINNMPMQPEEKPINVVFREVFGIDFNRLLPTSSIQRQLPSKNFFLCFVPANCEQYELDDGKRQALRRRTFEEHNLFVQFLRENGADAIYSMQDLGSYEPVPSGSWRYFIENIKTGAVIVSFVLPK